METPVGITGLGLAISPLGLFGFGATGAFLLTVVFLPLFLDSGSLREMYKLQTHSSFNG